jgi:hypothetical protein
MPEGQLKKLRARMTKMGEQRKQAEIEWRQLVADCNLLAAEMLVDNELPLSMVSDDLQLSKQQLYAIEREYNAGTLTGEIRFPGRRPNAESNGKATTKSVATKKSAKVTARKAGAKAGARKIRVKA